MTREQLIIEELEDYIEDLDNACNGPGASVPIVKVIERLTAILLGERIRE